MAERPPPRSDLIPEPEAPRRVFVVPSHRWLYSKLVENARRSPANIQVVDTRRDAELIIYLDPPWPEDGDAVRLTDFKARELVRTFVFSQSDFPFPWLPGMYASFRRRRDPTQRAFVGGFYVPHHLREPGGLAEHLAAARSLTPDVLWSFAGAGTNAPVRQRLLALDDDQAIIRDTQRFSDIIRWGWQTTHRSEAQEHFSDYATTIGRSKFVLCPRGRGPGSIRIFEALEAGRCPVIVADDWLQPPFVDWSSCSIHIAERDVAKLPRLLRDREAEAETLGAEARRVWERYFSPETQLWTLAHACIDVSDRIGLLTRLVVPPRAILEPSFVATAARKVRTSIRRVARS